MKHKSNTDRQEENLSKNNETEKSAKINLSGTFQDKNPKIFRLFRHDEKKKIISDNFNWDIKHGDYISNRYQKPKRLTKKSKSKIEIAVLIGFAIIVMLVIILISSFLADKIS